MKKLGVFLILIAIVLFAAWLRLGWAGVNSFAFDEAHLSLLALRMARGGEFASLGMPSSAGVPNFPAAVWLFALPFAISSDPLVATLFVGMIGVITAVGVWGLARDAYGAWAGIVAALFFAASPYAVLYSRSIWAQNLLAPFALVWLASAYFAVTRGRRWLWALHVAVAIFTPQVHLAGAALVLGTAYFVVRYRLWRAWLPVGVGVGVGVLTLMPFVVRFLTDAPIRDAFGAALGGATFDLVAFPALAQMAIGEGWHYLASGDIGGVWDVALLPLVVGALLILGGGVVMRDAVMARGATLVSRRAVLAEMALVLLVCTPLFFVRHSTPVFVHYMLLTLPALAVIAGAALSLLRRRVWQVGVMALWACIALVWGVQIAQSLTIAGEVETPNGLGTPLGVLRRAAYDVGHEALPILFFTHGDDVAIDGEAAIFDVLWWDRPHRIVRGDSLLILPDHPAILMATLAPFQAWEALQDGDLLQTVDAFPRREGALPFVMSVYDGASLPTGFTALDAPVTFADGSQVVGWRVGRIGERLRISTLWRVQSVPLADAMLQQFHHLYVDDAPMIADVTVSVHDWLAGDHLVVMADFFDVPEGDYRLVFGRYTLPDLRRIETELGDDVVEIAFSAAR